MDDRTNGARQVSVAEAAALLGVSVDTIKRRVRSGALQGSRDARGRLLVSVPEAPAAPQAPADAPQPAPHLQAMRRTWRPFTSASLRSPLSETGSGSASSGPNRSASSYAF